MEIFLRFGGQKFLRNFFGRNGDSSNRSLDQAEELGRPVGVVGGPARVV
jgi:hypothetical protein